MSQEKRKIVDCRLCANAEIFTETRYPEAKILGCNSTTPPQVMKDFTRVCSKYQFDKSKCKHFSNKYWYKAYKEEQIRRKEQDSTFEIEDLE